MAFTVIAGLTVLTTAGSPASTPGAQTLGLLLLILVFGVPHGALDPVAAHHLYRLRSTAAWAGFVLAYVVLAAAAIAVWVVWPSGFVVGFVILSAYHFSGDPAGDAPRLFRGIYGGLIIVLPTLTFAPEVARLLATLMPATAATMVTAALRGLAVPWLLAALLVAAGHARRDAAASRELLAVALLAVCAPPLWSFTIFFCLMHSARHVLRLQGSWDHVTWRSLVAAAALPVVATAVALGVGWHLLPDASTTTRAVQLVFVTLAALTLPHVILVERLRTRGAIDPGPTRTPPRRQTCTGSPS
jgi:beta-carotene 15,15'-dioxygenase